MNLLWLLAQADKQATPLEQLDPPSRAVVLMSLLALVLTGIGLIALTMIGARWVRRMSRERKPPRHWPQPETHDPAPPGKQLGPSGADSSETLDARRRSDETQS